MILDASNEVTLPQGKKQNPWSQLIGIAIHHTVTTANPNWTEAQERAHIRSIDAYHVSVGFGCFGYHMAVFPSGRVYQCGSLNGQRAHVAYRNHELVGIVLVGTFSTQLPSNQHLMAAGEAIEFVQANLVNNGGRVVPVKGHTEWATGQSPTGCPGMLEGFDWTPYLGGNDVGDTYNQQDIWAGYFNDKAFPAGNHSFNAMADFGWPQGVKYGMVQFLVKGGAAEVLHGNGQVAYNLGWGEFEHEGAYAETVIIKPAPDGWWSIQTNGIHFQGARALAYWT